MRARTGQYGDLRRLGAGAGASLLRSWRHLLLLSAACLAPERLYAAEPDLHVEYGDCATVLRGPVCVVPEDGRLTLWVRALPGTDIEFLLGRRRLAAQASASDELGTRFVLEIPDRDGDLRVRAAGTSRDAGFRLSLARETEPAFLTAVKKQVAEGDSDGAVAALEAALRGDGTPRRGSALGLLGRLHFRAGRPDAAHAALRAAVETNLAQGRQLEALRDANVLAFLLMHKYRRFSAAQAVYEPFASDPLPSAEAEFFTAYYRGLAALNAGDARNALSRLRKAADQASRMGWVRRQVDAETQLAEQLLQLGRRDEAYALLSSLRETGLPGFRVCERANFLTSLGWTALFLLEAGDAVPDPAPVLREALDLFDAQCSPNDRLNGGINLALAHLYAGRLGAAQAALDAAREVTDAPELRLVLWWLEAAGRIALANGQARTALRQFEKLAVLAQATLSPSARWRAAAGRAEALEGLGDREGALAAYADADRRLSDDLLRVPADAGRETLLAARARTTRAHLRALLDAGHDAQALALVRRSRARVLDGLRAPADLRATPGAAAAWDRAIGAYRALREELATAAGNAWSLPADELAQLSAIRQQQERELRALLDQALQSAAAHPEPELSAPAPGELHIAFHPLDEGWAVLTDDGGTVLAQRPACAQGAAGNEELVATCLLHAVSAQIEQARSLRLFPAGELQAVDFHALPFGAESLLARVPVVYGLDLGGAPARQRQSARALLVADPRGNLLESRREVEAIAKILTDTGLWSFDTLSGRAADVGSVRRGIEAADLFHFAGHASYGGARGWDSELALAEQSALDVFDILALARAPAFVVLSGCETARAAQVAPTESIGLANAFLASGASTVLAAIRPVEDTAAAALMQDFYTAWTHATPAAQALREAQLALRAARPDADWAAFRMIER